MITGMELTLFAQFMLGLVEGLALVLGVVCVQ